MTKNVQKKEAEGFKQIKVMKTLIEIYDRELDREGWSPKKCWKCKSLIAQRKFLILELKKMLPNKLKEDWSRKYAEDFFKGLLTR